MLFRFRFLILHMNPKFLHNLSFSLIFFLGLSGIALGLGWLIASEPWLLDQSANEKLLGTSFSEILSAPINQNLYLYLTMLYRFLGWWMISIGILVISYIIVTRMGTAMSRGFIHSVLFILLVGTTVIEKTFISSSPFLILTILLWLLWFVSLWSGIQLKKYDG